ncbi:MAG: transaldolase [Myxococcota bacterium]
MDRLKKLRDAGQSIWLDTITRELVTSGKLVRYIEEFSVTGLTSNPTIFEKAISSSSDYDASIKSLLGRDLSIEQLFFALAIEDLTIAADHFRPVYEASGRRDGFVSLEVSPTLANDVEATIDEALCLFAQAGRENLLIKVPGTPEGVLAIEELIFAGIPVNVTLLFSTEHYVAAAEAYVRGLERRRDAGGRVDVPSVASLFVSRWDRALESRVPANLRDRCGIAIAHRTYRAYRELLASDRWQRLAERGARPQRLLWASTGTKNPERIDTYYITALVADATVNTMPEATLRAFDEHGEVGDLLGADASGAERTIEAVEAAGVDLRELAARLQSEGRDAFVADFDKLLRGLESKAAALE